MRLPLRERLERFWRTDRGLSALLASLVAVIFVIPSLASRGDAGSFAAQSVFLTLVFGSGISASVPNRKTLAMASTVMAATVALFWIHYLTPSPRTGAWRSGAGAVACGMLMVLVLRRVFREGPITFHRIRGAVAVYLLLGLAWGNIYQLIEYVAPGAFHVTQSSANQPDLANSLGYYSFVTLTTIGYGDITPVHPAARSAAVVEALIGQLFPAILIARLVAMELGSRDRGGPGG